MKLVSGLLFLFVAIFQASCISQPTTERNLSVLNQVTFAYQGRTLRYLYHANGGIIGYFNDGSIAACPRCNLTRANVLTMFDKRPHGTYKIMNDGSLWVNDAERILPNNPNDNGWVLIDYHWHDSMPALR